jgi:hypothetical protein
VRRQGTKIRSCRFFIIGSDANHCYANVAIGVIFRELELNHGNLTANFPLKMTVVMLLKTAVRRVANYSCCRFHCDGENDS